MKSASEYPTSGNPHPNWAWRVTIEGAYIPETAPRYYFHRTDADADCNPGEVVEGVPLFTILDTAIANGIEVANRPMTDIMDALNQLP